MQQQKTVAFKKMHWNMIGQIFVNICCFETLLLQAYIIIVFIMNMSY